MSRAWLAVSLVRAARQPTRDAEAAAHLQSLRDRATIEGHTLVEIHRTLWATQAGQQALSVNVATGQVAEVWLPEVRLPDGSFVLINTAANQAAVVGWVPVRQVVAARRHQRRVGIRHSRPWGHERRVAHAAEAFLMAEAGRTFRTGKQPVHALQSPEDPQR